MSEELFEAISLAELNLGHAEAILGEAREGIATLLEEVERGVFFDNDELAARLRTILDGE